MKHHKIYSPQSHPHSVRRKIISCNKSPPLHIFDSLHAKVGKINNSNRDVCVGYKCKKERTQAKVYSAMYFYCGLFIVHDTLEKSIGALSIEKLLNCDRNNNRYECRNNVH